MALPLCYFEFVLGILETLLDVLDLLKFDALCIAATLVTAGYVDERLRTPRLFAIFDSTLKLLASSLSVWPPRFPSFQY